MRGREKALTGVLRGGAAKAQDEDQRGRVDSDRLPPNAITTTTSTMSLSVRGRPNALPFIRRRDGTLVYSSGTFVRPLPIPVPGSSLNSASGFHSAPTKEMDMRDLDKEEDLLDYADGGGCLLWFVSCRGGELT